MCLVLFSNFYFLDFWNCYFFLKKFYYKLVMEQKLILANPNLFYSFFKFKIFLSDNFLASRANILRFDRFSLIYKIN